MRQLLQLAQRPFSLFVAGLAAVFSAGCAAAQPTRGSVIESYASNYVYHRPSGEVIGGIQRLLEDRRFQIMPTMRGNAMQTEWKEVIGDDDVGAVQERYYIVVRPLTKEFSRVTAVRLQFSTVGMETWHPLRPFTRGGEKEEQNVNTQNFGKGLFPLPMGKPTVRRALDLEWDLIRRLDPSRARQIEVTADYVANNDAAANRAAEPEEAR